MDRRDAWSAKNNQGTEALMNGKTTAKQSRAGHDSRTHGVAQSAVEDLDSDFVLLWRSNFNGFNRERWWCA